MADLELLLVESDCRRPHPPGWAAHQSHSSHSGGNGDLEEAGRERNLSPWPADCGGRRAPAPSGHGEVQVCCEEEGETCFGHLDEAGTQELSFSDDEAAPETAGKSRDYAFISAVTFLVTGISLVVISYVVPWRVEASPESVSAREMERLEQESARVGAHLDRCVIAGLCLLTLGGVVLSTLLTISMWKGEMDRRRAFAYSKQAAKLYGSVSFRAAPSLSADEEEDDAIN